MVFGQPQTVLAQTVDTAEVSIAKSGPRAVLVQFFVRNMSMHSLKEEQVYIDFYVAFTWRQHTTDAALLNRTQQGCAGSLEPGDPAYDAAVKFIPQGELMNARDCELKLGEPAALMIFEANSKWGHADAYGGAGASIPAFEMAPLRAVYHLKGTFSIENVIAAAADFPFDVHYPSIVFESWEESDDLLFVPSPFDKNNTAATLDATSDIPLFPLAEWDLVRGQAHGLQDGVRLWTFVREYKSDIFTTDGSGRSRGASFSNIILTFAVSRQPAYFLTQVVPVLLLMALMSISTLWMPLYDYEALSCSRLAAKCQGAESGVNATAVDADTDVLAIRLSVMPTLVLAAVAFKLALADVLPVTPRMTYLDSLFSNFYLANSLAAVLTVVANLNPNHAELLDRIAVVGFAVLLSVSLLHFLSGWARRPRPIQQTAEGVQHSDAETARRRRLKLRV